MYTGIFPLISSFEVAAYQLTRQDCLLDLETHGTGGTGAGYKTVGPSFNGKITYDVPISLSRSPRDDRAHMSRALPAQPRTQG